MAPRRNPGEAPTSQLDSPPAQELPSREEPVDSAHEVLPRSFYERRWGRMAMRHRAEEVDDFGLDPSFESSVQPLFEALYRHWFRVQVEGAEHVPSEGRALIVCNHSGTVPLDGVMLKMALRLGPNGRELRWLAEDMVFHMPFLGAFMNRIGAVRACQENAERLLDQDKLVAVFPEGKQGIAKLYRDRYQLQRFGRGGYIKLALRMGTPVLPVAVVGAEETNPLLAKIVGPARALGLPYFPITPTFPLLGPLGLLPLPTRWRIIFGQPIELGEQGVAAAQDAVLVNRLNEQVRATIQSMIDDAVAARESVF